MIVNSISPNFTHRFSRIKQAAHDKFRINFRKDNDTDTFISEILDVKEIIREGEEILDTAKRHETEGQSILKGFPYEINNINSIIESGCELGYRNSYDAKSETYREYTINDNEYFGILEIKRKGKTVRRVTFQPETCEVVTIEKNFQEDGYGNKKAEERYSIDKNQLNLYEKGWEERIDGTKKSDERYGFDDNSVTYYGRNFKRTSEEEFSIGEEYIYDHGEFEYFGKDFSSDGEKEIYKIKFEFNKDCPTKKTINCIETTTI